MKKIKNLLIEKNIIKQDGKINTNFSRMLKKFPIIEKEIILSTAFLKEESNLKQRIFHIKNEIYEIPKCQFCNKSASFEQRGTMGYKITCGIKCGNKLSRSKIDFKKLTEKRSNTMNKKDKNGLTKYQIIYKKAHITKIKNGNHIPDDQRTDFQIYKSKCYKFTYKNDLTKLKGFENRGLNGKFNATQLDHKISISYGFLNNIDPQIIGHIKNLEFISWESNIKKHNRCSISLEELKQLIAEK